MQFLQQIASACETRQKLGPKPIRFKVSLPNMKDIVFGDELSIDLMFIDGQVVLHVVITMTRSLLRHFSTLQRLVWTKFRRSLARID
jgi:hypothetical protein